jgi:hypothetical protein
MSSKPCDIYPSELPFAGGKIGCNTNDLQFITGAGTTRCNVEIALESGSYVNMDSLECNDFSFNSWSMSNSTSSGPAVKFDNSEFKIMNPKQGTYIAFGVNGMTIGGNLVIDRVQVIDEITGIPDPTIRPVGKINMLGKSTLTVDNRVFVTPN